MSTSEYRPAALKPRVLVIEDEFLIADMLGCILDDMGCEALGPFSHVDDALKALPSIEPDAAIVDLMLAGQTAYPIAKMLSDRNIPFGFASGTDVEHSTSEWANHHFIAKPYTSEDVAALIRRLLPTFTPQNEERPAGPENRA